MKEQLWLNWTNWGMNLTDLFGSFGLDFFSDDELLLTETDLTEQKLLNKQNKQKLDNSMMETLTILFTEIVE